MMNMMKSKKGFTIIELVIVIAVIAILAAVLIPTFASIIKKANRSADEQAVYQMNTVLAAEFPDEKPEFKEVVKALSDAGFNADKTLVPVSKDCSFYWDPAYNRVVLFDDVNKVVLAPADYDADGFKALFEEGTVMNLEGSLVYVPVTTDSVSDIKKAALNGTKEIILSANTTVENSSIIIPSGSETAVDLSGKTLSAGDRGRGDGSHLYALQVYGDVTLSNGKIGARGVEVYAGGTLTITDDVTIDCIDTNGGACLWIYPGATVVIEGGTYTTKGNGSGEYVKAPGLINNSGTLTIKGGTFTSTDSACYAIMNTGDLTIEGGTFAGERGVIGAEGGSLTINGGKFTTTGTEKLDTLDIAYALYAGNAVVTVNAGEFVNANGANTVCVDSSANASAKIVLKKDVKVNGVALAEDMTLVKGDYYK